MFFPPSLSELGIFVFYICCHVHVHVVGKEVGKIERLDTYVSDRQSVEVNLSLSSTHGVSPL